MWVHISKIVVNCWLWFWLIMSWMSPHARSLWSWSISSRVLCVGYLIYRFIITFLWRIWSSPWICVICSLIWFHWSISFNQASVFSVYLKILLKGIRFLFVCSERLFSRMNSRELILIFLLIFNFLSIVLINLIFEFLINTNSWYTSSHSFLDWIG